MFPKHIDVATVFLQLGFGLLVIVVTKYIIGTALLIVGIGLNHNISQTIIVASFMISFYAMYLFHPSTWLSCSILVGLSYTTLLGIALLITDQSIDGQHYHFQAIYSIAHGWNPITENSIFQLPWLHCPKSHGSSTIQKQPGLHRRSIIRRGGQSKPQRAKLRFFWSHPFFSGLGVLLHLGYSRLSAAIVAVAATANPVTLTQLFTRMTDGILGATILLFVVFAIDWIQSKRVISFMGVAATIVFAVNLKFSAIRFFGIFCAFACLDDDRTCAATR
jgi:hypothetical protein